MLREKLLSGSFALCCFFSLAVSAFGQTPNANSKAMESDAQTTKALLEEVRQLRLILQRNSVATYRAQVTLERLKLQQAVVGKLTDDLEQLRRNIKGHEHSFPQNAEQAADFEKIVALAKTPEERIEREITAKEIKKEAERRKQELQDLREREPQLAARLQVEQVKLNELNESLDKLERELDNATADGEKGKRP